MLFLSYKLYSLFRVLNVKHKVPSNESILCNSSGVGFSISWAGGLFLTKVGAKVGYFILNLGLSSVGLVICVPCQPWVMKASLKSSLGFASTGVPPCRSGGIPRPVHSRGWTRLPAQNQSQEGDVLSRVGKLPTGLGTQLEIRKLTLGSGWKLNHPCNTEQRNLQALKLGQTCHTLMNLGDGYTEICYTSLCFTCIYIFSGLKAFTLRIL